MRRPAVSRSRIRRGAQPARPLLVRLTLAAGFLLSLGAIGHVASGFFQDSPYFRLAQLQVEGVSEPVALELQGLAEAYLKNRRNLLSFDASALARQIASHPRVRNLSLEKLYPDTLVVRAQERQPAAVVSAEGFYLVDWEGFVMEKLRPAALRDLDFPYITGIPSDQVQVGEKIYNSNIFRALDLVRMLRDHNPSLYARFSEVHAGRDPVSGLDNVTALLKGGMEVRFGDRNPIERLPHFDLFVKLMTEQNVDPFAMAYLDLRFENQLVYMDRATAIAHAAGLMDQLRAPEEKKKPMPGPASASTAPRGADGAASSASRDAAMRSGAYDPYAGQPAPQRMSPPPSLERGWTDVIEPAAPAQPRGLSRFMPWRRRGEAPPRDAEAAPPAGAFFSGRAGRN